MKSLLLLATPFIISGVSAIGIILYPTSGGHAIIEVPKGACQGWNYDVNGAQWATQGSGSITFYSSGNGSGDGTDCVGDSKTWRLDDSNWPKDFRSDFGRYAHSVRVNW